MADTKIIIATPAFGEMFYTPYVQALLRLQRMADQRKWTIRHMAISYANVGEARNALLTHWFDKTDFTHLLFVDADMGFEPQLIADMLAFDKPIVGVIYAKRRVDLQKLASLAAVRCGPGLESRQQVDGPAPVRGGNRGCVRGHHSKASAGRRGR